MKSLPNLAHAILELTVLLLFADHAHKQTSEVTGTSNKLSSALVTSGVHRHATRNEQHKRPGPPSPPAGPTLRWLRHFGLQIGCLFRA